MRIEDGSGTVGCAARRLAAGLVALLASLPLAAQSPEAAPSGDAPPRWKWFATARTRFESDHNLLNTVDDQRSYVAYRIDLGGSLDLKRGLGMVFDVQSLGLWGENDFPCDAFDSAECNRTRLGLFRGYIEAREIRGSPFSVRVGRQPLAFGDEWLLGDLDFYAGTSWDGIRGDVRTKSWQMSAFWAKVAESDVPDASGSTSASAQGDADLYGVWSTWQLWKRQVFDATALYFRDRRTAGDLPFRDKRLTLAVRYNYEAAGNGFFVNLDVANQFGGDTVNRAGTALVPVKSHAFELTTGAKLFQNSGSKFRLSGRLAQMSGDDAVRPFNEAFVPVAQDFHGRYGFLDYWVGRSENLSLSEALAGLQIVQLSLEDRNHSGYRLLGLFQIVRSDEAIGAASRRDLGTEYGLLVEWIYYENFSLEASIAEFNSNDELRKEGFFRENRARRAYLHLSMHY